MPRVSIVMPVYNGSAFLNEAIDSMLSQSFRDFEFVIVDDGSTDESPEIIELYAHRDERVRAHTMVQNSGIVAALNAGVQASTGEYVARMDADDISMPERLQHQVEYLDASDVGAVGTNYIKFGQARMKTKRTQLPLSPDQLRDTLPYTCCLGHPSVMFLRSAFDAVGGYDNAYAKGGAEDYDLWLRMSLVYGLANIQEPLLRYRVHGSSLTAVAKTEDRYAYNSVCAVTNYFSRLYGLAGVSPPDGHEAIVLALSRALEACQDAGQQRCLIRWTIRFARYCLTDVDMKARAKACVTKYGTVKEKVKWRLYGIG